MMEAASAPTGEPTAAPEPNAYDVSHVHDLLNQAADAYHSLFEGRVADEVHRFEQFLNTVRMIVDQSADSASKE